MTGNTAPPTAQFAERTLRSITLAIDLEKRLVYSSFHGVITDEEFARHSETIKSHPQLDLTFDEIVDGRGITDFQVSSRTLDDLALKESILSAESLHVIIAPAGPLARLARIFKEAGQGTRPNLHIARTPEDAYEYIRQCRTA